jgi:hypothetical protein
MKKKEKLQFFLIFFLKNKKIIVIHKVMKTQHPNPEFGHTWGEIQKKLTKNKVH